MVRPALLTQPHIGLPVRRFSWSSSLCKELQLIHLRGDDSTLILRSLSDHSANLVIENAAGPTRSSSRGAPSVSSTTASAIMAIIVRATATGLLVGSRAHVRPLLTWIKPHTFSLRLCCVGVPWRRIVMKPSPMVNFCGPVTGRLSMPALSVGSDNWPAFTAASELARTDACAACMAAERSVTDCNAASSVKGAFWACASISAAIRAAFSGRAQWCTPA